MNEKKRRNDEARGWRREEYRERTRREPHGYRRPEVGLPWREAPSNPPQMLSSTSSWSDVSARATTRESTWYLNQLGTTESGCPNVAWLRARSARVTRKKTRVPRRTEKYIAFIVFVFFSCLLTETSAPQFTRSWGFNRARKRKPRL